MERILVVLPNWFGETLFATPLLIALRTLRPKAFIATLGWPQCRDVLLHNDDVNALLDYDEQGAHRGLAGKWQVIQVLRAQRFDTVLILRRSLSRSLLLTLAGIPTRVGFSNAKSGWLLTQRVPPPQRATHKAASYLELLNGFGPVPSLAPYRYVVSEEERRASRELLRPSPNQHGSPVVILHPGANWAHKRWPAERFAALGQRLAASQGAHIVITGGPDDVALAGSIREGMQQPAGVLAGRTTLRELGACLEQAHLVVSNDTGVLHMASALGRPVVALYGPTSPAFTGPLGDPNRTIVLHHPGCCPRIPCYHPVHPGYPGMSAITVEEAHAAAAHLLETPR